jgi:hypothetical protein
MVDIDFEWPEGLDILDVGTEVIITDESYRQFIGKYLGQKGTIMERISYDITLPENKILYQIKFSDGNTVRLFRKRFEVVQ